MIRARPHCALEWTACWGGTSDMAEVDSEKFISKEVEKSLHVAHVVIYGPCIRFHTGNFARNHLLLQALP